MYLMISIIWLSSKKIHPSNHKEGDWVKMTWIMMQMINQWLSLGVSLE